MKTTITSWANIFLLAVFSTSCTAPQDASNPSNLSATEPQLGPATLFVHRAPAGKISHANDENDEQLYTIHMDLSQARVVRGRHIVTAFSDRPARHARELPIEDYVSQLWSGSISFKTKGALPTAAIFYEYKGVQRRSIVVLTNLAYDAAKQHLTYTVKEASILTPIGQKDPDGMLPTSDTEVTNIIVSLEDYYHVSDEPLGKHLGAQTPPSSAVMSPGGTSLLFTQRAPTGKLEPTSGGVYLLTLDVANAAKIVGRPIVTELAANKPAANAREIFLDHFIDLWRSTGNESFTKDPPNAALFYLENGLEKRAVVTLEDVAYDPIAQKVVYHIREIIAEGATSGLPNTAIEIKLAALFIDNFFSSIGHFFTSTIPDAAKSAANTVVDAAKSTVNNIYNDVRNGGSLAVNFAAHTALQFANSLQSIQCELGGIAAGTVGGLVDFAVGDEKDATMDMAEVTLNCAAAATKSRFRNKLLNATVDTAVCGQLPADQNQGGVQISSCGLMNKSMDTMVSAMMGAGPGVLVSGVLWGSLVGPAMGCGKFAIGPARGSDPNLASRATHGTATLQQRLATAQTQISGENSIGRSVYDTHKSLGQTTIDYTSPPLSLFNSLGFQIYVYEMGCEATKVAFATIVQERLQKEFLLNPTYNEHLQSKNQPLVVGDIKNALKHICLPEDEFKNVTYFSSYNQINLCALIYLSIDGLDISRPLHTAIWNSAVAPVGLASCSEPRPREFDVCQTEGCIKLPHQIAAWAQHDAPSRGIAVVLDSKGQIYHGTNSPSQVNWGRIDGTLKQVAIGPAGELWGVTNALNIYYRASLDSGWQPIEGVAKQVAVGPSGEVWAVNERDQIYYRGGIHDIWHPVDGSAKQISVNGPGGQVWAVNKNGAIFYRAGISSSWQAVDGRLRQLSAGPNGELWGVNSLDHIYYRRSINHPWQQVGGSLRQLSVGPQGEVWGINAASNIYYRSGIGGAWQLVRVEGNHTVSN